MLLDSQRSANLLLVCFLSLINALLFVYMFTVGTYTRFFILIAIAGFSIINLKQIRLVLRIEPISAIYKEWSDQQVLLALLSPDQKEQLKKEAKYQKIQVHEIPLTHHQFIGDNAENIRTRLAAQMLKKYSKSKIIEPGKDSIQRLKLMGDLRERENDKEARKNPIIIFSSNFDEELIKVERLGVYCFVTSNSESLPISRKVFDKEACKKVFDADLDIGYFNGAKLLQLQ